MSVKHRNREDNYHGIYFRPGGHLQQSGASSSAQNFFNAEFKELSTDNMSELTGEGWFSIAQVITQSVMVLLAGGSVPSRNRSSF